MAADDSIRERRAKAKRCPKCGRKSALVNLSDSQFFQFACRWDDCDYCKLTPKPGTWAAGD